MIMIMVMGDLNARTNNVSDMIDNDHDDHLPIGDHYLLDSSIPPRNNQDQVINDRYTKRVVLMTQITIEA